MVNKHVVLRINCGQCRRFLCKIVVGEPFRLFMIPCSNCKHLNAISSDKELVVTKIIPSKSEVREPEGEISETTINKFMNNSIELYKIN